MGYFVQTLQHPEVDGLLVIVFGVANATLVHLKLHSTMPNLRMRMATAGFSLGTSTGT
jgi:hypothetical protein